MHIVHIILSFCTKITDSLNISQTKQAKACMSMPGDAIVDASSCICNCIALLREAYTSCYKLFDWYCCTLKLIIYDRIHVVRPNINNTSDKHDKKSCQK